MNFYKNGFSKITQKALNMGLVLCNAFMFYTQMSHGCIYIYIYIYIYVYIIGRERCMYAYYIYIYTCIIHIYIYIYTHIDTHARLLNDKYAAEENCNDDWAVAFHFYKSVSNWSPDCQKPIAHDSLSEPNRARRARCGHAARPCVRAQLMPLSRNWCWDAAQNTFNAKHPTQA